MVCMIESITLKSCYNLYHNNLHSKDIIIYNLNMFLLYKNQLGLGTSSIESYVMMIEFVFIFI